MLPVILFSLVFLGFGVLVFYAKTQNDRQRIAHEVIAQGGKVVSIRWTPFGYGWVGDSGDRVYQVVWIDRFGYRREASCKTSTLSGLYFAEKNPPPPVEHSQLASQAENELLLKQIEKLKRENEMLRQGKPGSD
jgi:hypothetical protein